MMVDKNKYIKIFINDVYIIRTSERDSIIMNNKEFIQYDRISDYYHLNLNKFILNLKKFKFKSV